MSFDRPWFFLAAVPVLLAAWALVRRRRLRLDPALVFSSVRLVEGLPRTLWSRLGALPDGLRIAALLMIVVALARPQRLAEPADQEARGIDVVLAVDTSGSMRAADFQPRDRMAVAKRAIADFIKQRSTDRIGLVVFAAEAATWVPLTLDYTLLLQMLDEVEVGMLPDGTAIGSALGTAVNRLRESRASSRVVVLLTDGDDNAGNISPRKAAELAKEMGVRVYTILIGKGGPVPFPAGEDMFGRTIYREEVLPVDPELLEDLAEMTGGAAYRAEDSAALDDRLGQVLDTLDRSRLESSLAEPPKEELFPYAVGLALLLLALELGLGATRLRRFP